MGDVVSGRMSYAVNRAAQSCTSSPPTTAPIFHFACLYTHDLRRKQKKWQDGEVKLHTFNKRYMLYDERGGFVGDGHWQGDVHEFGESLELELDRGAAIVQVDRCTGSTDQDLTEILDKRAKEVEKRRASAAARTPAPSARSARPDQTPMRHRPLNELMPNRGPIGRAAIPSQSPYEARKTIRLAQQETERQPALPPTKGRRANDSPPSKMGHAQSLFGTKLTLNTGIMPRNPWKKKVVRLDRNLPQEWPESKATGEEEEEKDQASTSTSHHFPQRIKIARKHAMLAQGNDITSKPEGLGTKRALLSNAHTPKVRQDEDKQAPDQHDEQLEENQEQESRNNENGFLDNRDDSRNTVPSQCSPEPQRKPRAKAEKNISSTIPRETQHQDEKHKKQSVVELDVSGPTTSESGGSHNSNGSLHAKTKKVPRRNVVSAPKKVDTKKQSKKGPLSKESKEKKAKKDNFEKEHHHIEKQLISTESHSFDVTSLEVNEKRTQLRSKSRPKRGLLILSELSEKTCLQAENSNKAQQETSRTTRTEKKAASYHEEVMGISLDDSEDSSMPSKTTAPKAIKKRKERKEKSEESDDSGPRITKMARKSVKSKEIIGFAVPMNDLIPASFLSMVNPLATEPCAEVEPPEAQRPKIANPATRGEKAARKEDAAGQVPRSTVPFEPALPDPIAVPSCRVLPTDEDMLEPKQDSGQQSKGGTNTSKATLTTGAWSKHAEDLLGMTRPVGKAGRR